MSIDILLELIASGLKTDKCSSVETKRQIQLHWLRIRYWPSLYFLYGYLERRTTLPRGLVVGVSDYEARGPESIPWFAYILSVFFYIFFNILMLNCFIY